MGFKPRSRREALIYELCVRLGYCNELTAQELADELGSQKIVEMVLVSEGLDPVRTDRKLREPVACMLDDWLFDPRGRGVRSGLPR